MLRVQFQRNSARRNFQVKKIKVEAILQTRMETKMFKCQNGYDIYKFKSQYNVNIFRPHTSYITPNQCFE